jgi:hypothetical protein
MSVKNRRLFEKINGGNLKITWLIYLLLEGLGFVMFCILDPYLHDFLFQKYLTGVSTF